MFFFVFRAKVGKRIVTTGMFHKNCVRMIVFFAFTVLFA